MDQDIDAVPEYSIEGGGIGLLAGILQYTHDLPELMLDPPVAGNDRGIGVSAFAFPDRTFSRDPDDNILCIANIPFYVLTVGDLVLVAADLQPDDLTGAETSVREVYGSIVAGRMLVDQVIGNQFHHQSSDAGCRVIEIDNRGTKDVLRVGFAREQQQAAGRKDQRVFWHISV
jgi:hypothetical protein